MEDIDELEGTDFYRSRGPARDSKGRFVSTMTESERFESHVDRSDLWGCHLWTGPINGQGRPRFRTRDGWVLAYRYAWLQAGLPLDAEDTLDHLVGRGLPCTGIVCVKTPDQPGPAHLEAVPNPENVRRRHERERQMIRADL